MWLTSVELIEKAGISRATLNNYIKYGLIPKPVVKRPENVQKRQIKRVGYFPESVLKRIEQIRNLKKDGHKMENIIDRLKLKDAEKLKEDLSENEKQKVISSQEIDNFIKSHLSNILVLKLILKELEKSSSFNLSREDYIQVAIKIWHLLQCISVSSNSMQSDT